MSLLLLCFDIFFVKMVDVKFLTFFLLFFRFVDFESLETREVGSSRIFSNASQRHTSNATQASSSSSSFSSSSDNPHSDQWKRRRCSLCHQNPRSLLPLFLCLKQEEIQTRRRGRLLKRPRFLLLCPRITIPLLLIITIIKETMGGGRPPKPWRIRARRIQPRLPIRSKI